MVITKRERLVSGAGSKASFDDVMVEGDTVTNTLAVDPQSKLSTTWSSIKTRPWKQYFLD